jgi:hypothetical protein
MAQRGHGLLQRLALASNRPTRRLRLRSPVAVSTRSPRPDRPMKVSAPRAQGQAQAGHFGQAAGDERGTGIQAQLQAVAQAGGNGQHVLDGAAHFHAHQIVVGIDPQVGLWKAATRADAHSWRVRWRPPVPWAGPGPLPAQSWGRSGHPPAGPGCHLCLHLVRQQAPGPAPWQMPQSPCTARPRAPCSRQRSQHATQAAMGVATMTRSAITAAAAQRSHGRLGHVLHPQPRGRLDPGR